ncbi:MAG: hypothetical protein EB084_11580 [Proteobacteria bacterium]|nr:hypothetical protein [Pseudomonadota bacterium]
MRRIIVLAALNLLAFALIESGTVSAYAFDRDQAAIETRMHRWQCSASDLAVREIGWADDLDTAFALARASGRPVFVVTGDGEICTGRV